MKGKISLKDFIHQVKDELIDAQDDSKTPFYELETVELEVAFALETKGGAKGKLVVLELGGETTAAQTHRVTLTLKPLPLKSSKKKHTARTKKQSSKKAKAAAGGGGAISHRKLLGSDSTAHGPIYDKVNDELIP